MRISFIVPMAELSEFVVESVKSVLADPNLSASGLETECILVAAKQADADKVQGELASTGIQFPGLKIVVQDFACTGAGAKIGCKTPVAIGWACSLPRIVCWTNGRARWLKL